MDFAKYNLTPPALNNGDVLRDMQVDSAGRMLVSGTPSAAAQDSTGATKAPVYTPLGYRQVTATSGAFALPTPPAGTRRAVVQAEAQAIRWRDDGTDPTAAIGMTISVGGELRYDGATMSAIKMIAASAGAIANIAYYS